MMRSLLSLIPIMYGFFLWYFFFGIFGFICHARTFIPRQNISSTNTVQYATDPNDNSAIQRLSRLDIPIKYHYLIGSTILVPAGGGFFILLLMLKVDTMHSPIYH